MQQRCSLFGQWTIIMVVTISRQLYLWLHSMGVLSPQSTPHSRPLPPVLTFPSHLLIYLQNGYVVAIVLRKIIALAGEGGEGLLRVRKIAHITSNQNWRIIGDVLAELGFDEPIDPEEVMHQQLENILEFLYCTFAPVKHASSSKSIVHPHHIDPVTFDPRKPIPNAANLLEFLALATVKGLGLSIGEFLGLIVGEGRYFKRTVVGGAGRGGFGPVVEMYQLVVQNMPTLNRLIAKEEVNEGAVMGCIGVAVLSQHPQVNQLGCLLLSNLTSKGWLQQEGWLLMLRSPHDSTLQLLLKSVDPHFHLLFTPTMHQQFPNPTIQLRHYRTLLKFIYRSVHSRTILSLLPLSYYISQASRLFQPDSLPHSSTSSKMAARHLLATTSTLFWSKLSHVERGQILFVFDPSFCSSGEQRYASICHLFEMVGAMGELDEQMLRRGWGRIQQEYNNGGEGVRQFIVEQYLYFYRMRREDFPVEMFLANYQLQPTVQGTHYQLLTLLASRKDLSIEAATSLVRVCYGYFKTQLMGGAFAESIQQLLGEYGLKGWGEGAYQSILGGWLEMKIPTYEPNPPPPTNKMKMRSVGLRKKEMLQFTELNRNKKLLLMLSEVRDGQFLEGYRGKVNGVISRVEKSGRMEVKSSRGWLLQLLQTIDAKRIQLRQGKQRRQQTVGMTRVTPLREEEEEEDSILDGVVNGRQGGYYQQQIAESMLLGSMREDFPPHSRHQSDGQQ